MDGVFSVDEIPGEFWPASAHSPEVEVNVVSVESDGTENSKMNISASEWAFQLFIREFSSTSAADGGAGEGTAKNSVSEAGPPPNVSFGSEEYQIYLKNKLNHACAAVAMARASFFKARESSHRADSGTQALNASEQGSPASSKATVKNPGAPVQSITSGSEVSEDDEGDSETETTADMNLVDTKRVKRMVSNRESARRSRRRKQMHLTKLETQVSQLRVDNSDLMKRLTDITHTYKDATVENRDLKANVETLRAKVKMAEETVKRITGLNPIFHAMAMPSVSTTSVPNSAASTEIAVPIQDDPKNLVLVPSPDKSLSKSKNTRASKDCLTEISSATNKPLTGCKIGRTGSMHRVASLEHLQKRIRSAGEQ